MNIHLTTLERRILKLARHWKNEQWTPGKEDTRAIRLMQWIQRQACGDAILDLFPKVSRAARQSTGSGKRQRVSRIAGRQSKANR